MFEICNNKRTPTKKLVLLRMIKRPCLLGTVLQKLCHLLTNKPIHVDPHKYLKRSHASTALFLRPNLGQTVVGWGHIQGWGQGWLSREDWGWEAEAEWAVLWWGWGQNSSGGRTKWLTRVLRSDGKDHLVTQLIKALLPTSEHVLISTYPSVDGGDKLVNKLNLH